ncbi:MAG: ACT domain-containing protein [bacterium]
MDSLEPWLDPVLYVFAVVPIDSAVPDCAVASIKEDEGLTAVLPEYLATGMTKSEPMRRITIRLETSLTMVGLTADFSAKLADACIPANVIAGYYHDHIFVPAAMAEQALAVLSP